MRRLDALLLLGVLERVLGPRPLQLLRPAIQAFDLPDAVATLPPPTHCVASAPRRHERDHLAHRVKEQIDVRRKMNIGLDDETVTLAPQRGLGFFLAKR